MQLVTVLAVEIFLEHQLAVSRDQDSLDLGRVHGLDRHVHDHLDESLDSAAIDVDVRDTRGRPAVVAGRGRPVHIAIRRATAREESTVGIEVAPEVIGAAPVREGEREDAVFAVELCREQHAFGLRAPFAADQSNRVAAPLEVVHVVEHPDVSLGIAQEGADRPVRPLCHHQIERELVVARIDVASPAIRAIRIELHRCGIAESVHHGFRRNHGTTDGGHVGSGRPTPRAKRVAHYRDDRMRPAGLYHLDALLDVAAIGLVAILRST